MCVYGAYLLQVRAVVQNVVNCLQVEALLHLGVRAKDHVTSALNDQKHF